jgi:hypothetical protein
LLSHESREMECSTSFNVALSSCEISGDEPSGYRVVLTEPDGTEHSEMFATSEAAHGRWLQIQEQLRNDGWWGPHGRE